MNIVLDEAFEEKPGGEKVAIGMIVRFAFVLDHTKKSLLIVTTAGDSRQLSRHARGPRTDKR